MRAKLQTLAVACYPGGGAENTNTRRLSAPVRAVCYISSNAEVERLLAGSNPEYKTAQAEIGVGRSCAVFSAPGVFRISGKDTSGADSLITGSEKAITRKGVKPVFSHPKKALPANRARAWKFSLFLLLAMFAILLDATDGVLAPNGATLLTVVFLALAFGSFPRSEKEEAPGE